MEPVILMIEYQPSDRQQALSAEQRRERAEQISRIEGLKWKYWLRDVRSGKMGGVYLFDNSTSMDRARVILEQSLTQAGATNVSSRAFEVDGDLSAITRGSL